MSEPYIRCALVARLFDVYNEDVFDAFQRRDLEVYEDKIDLICYFLETITSLTSRPTLPLSATGFGTPRLQRTNTVGEAPLWCRAALSDA